MFLTLNNDSALTQKYIASVVYHLHPVYVTCRIEVRDPPFLLSRSAYVPFIVGVEVFFQEWTRMPTIRLDYIPVLETFGQI